MSDAAISALESVRAALRAALRGLSGVDYAAVIGELERDVSFIRRSVDAETKPETRDAGVRS